MLYQGTAAIRQEPSITKTTSLPESAPTHPAFPLPVLCASLSFSMIALPWLSPSSVRSFSLAAQSLSAVVSLFYKNHALITDLPQGTAPFLCSHSKQGRRHHWVVSRYCLHFFTCHSFTHGNYIPMKLFMSRSRETYYLNQPLGSTVTSGHSPSSDTFFPWFLSYKTIWLSA